MGTSFKRKPKDAATTDAGAKPKVAKPADAQDLVGNAALAGDVKKNPEEEISELLAADPKKEAEQAEQEQEETPTVQEPDKAEKKVEEKAPAAAAVAEAPDAKKVLAMDDKAVEEDLKKTGHPQEDVEAAKANLHTTQKVVAAKKAAAAG
jgi:hypothetical protein